MRREWDAVLQQNPGYFSMKTLKIMGTEKAQIPPDVECQSFPKFKYVQPYLQMLTGPSQLTNQFLQRKGTSMNQEILQKLL